MDGPDSGGTSDLKAYPPPGQWEIPHLADAPRKPLMYTGFQVRGGYPNGASMNDFDMTDAVSTLIMNQPGTG